MENLKIFGERNCGTRYLASLLSANTRVFLLPGGVPDKRGWMRSQWLFDRLYPIIYKHHLGWKHAFPDVNALLADPRYGTLAVVFLIKNPYSFLWSLFRRPYHFKGVVPDTFEVFLKTPWQPLRRENAGKHTFENPMHLWNAKAESYLKACDQPGNNATLIRYEDLVTEPERVIRQLVSRFNLPAAESGFSNVLSSTKPDAHDYAYYRDYTINQRWRQHLKPEHLEIINRHLDFGVMQQLGYLVV